MKKKKTLKKAKKSTKFFQKITFILEVAQGNMIERN